MMIGTGWAAKPFPTRCGASALVTEPKVSV
jgi:hypothetical protein